MRCRVCGVSFLGNAEDKHHDGAKGECARLFKNARRRVAKKADDPKSPVEPGSEKDEGIVLMELALHRSCPDEIRAHLMQTED